MIVSALMILIGVTSLVAIWFCVSAIARMSPCTRFSIRISFVAKATGLATVFAAALDFFFGDPYVWPWLMLFGVALSNAGTAGIYMSNRRCCRCPECPVRRVVTFEDRPA